jgi:alkylation response protein AidB-like acyl-CoA dehydrogenase
MDIPLTEATADRRAALLAYLRDAVVGMQAHAAALDERPMFPTDDLDTLRGIGALAASVPYDLGGLGMGTEPDGATALCDALRLLGRGNLAVGRIYEGHVNALRLISRFGTLRQRQRAADDARAGRLFAIWVTDDPRDPLRHHAGVLAGSKAICSAAGHATRALVTVDVGEAEPQMAVLALTGAERVLDSTLRAQGMRAARSLPVSFDGMPIDAGDFLGVPGDYLREPDFSTGAWRTTAVTLGGLEALVDLAASQLVARGRDADPHQRARIGQALLAQETARLWTREAAAFGEGVAADPADAVAYVNLARLAVETACLDAIRLVQRSLGLAAFGASNPVERICRDLATYLRQPAPDEVLTLAAEHFMRRPLPGDTWRGVR